MIDVIIPAYNSHNNIENLICSLITQTIKNRLRVYIIDDCSDENYTKIVEKYKEYIQIKEIKTKKNGGPGVARQLGIDNSSSDYIIFADSDDMFDNCYSIEGLYKTIKEKNVDVVSSYFTEELERGTFFDHLDNSIWLHGKIYRRSFLKDNNIKFNDSRSNEDTGFNKLVSLLTDIFYLKEYTYIWKYNKSSTTRTNDFNFYGLEGYMYNICWAAEEGKKRNADENKIAFIIYETIIEIYYRYIYFYNKKDKNKIIEWSNKLKKYYKKYKEKITEEQKKEILRYISQKYIEELGSDLFINIPITFNNFLDLI